MTILTKRFSGIMYILNIFNSIGFKLGPYSLFSDKVKPKLGIYSMAKCNGCTLVINQSYWLEILQTIIKSFEGWGQVIIFLLLELTTLVFSVSISSVYKSLHPLHFAMEYMPKAISKRRFWSRMLSNVSRDNDKIKIIFKKQISTDSI